MYGLHDLPVQVIDVIDLQEFLRQSSSTLKGLKDQDEQDAKESILEHAVFYEGIKRGPSFLPLAPVLKERMAWNSTLRLWHDGAFKWVAASHALQRLDNWHRHDPYGTELIVEQIAWQAEG